MQNSTEIKDRFGRFTDIAYWAASYRSKAKKDQFKEIADAIDTLGLGVQPEDFVDTSLLLVDSACSSIRKKGLNTLKFLNQQIYRPTESNQPLYFLTFEITPTLCGRIVCDHKFSRIDLFHFQLDSWYSNQTERIHRLFISRIDTQEIDHHEKQRIERVLKDDCCSYYIQIGNDFLLEYFNNSCDTLMFTVPRNTEDDQTVPHKESSEITQNEIKTTRPYEEVIGQYEPFYPTKQFIDFFKELHESIRIFKSHIAEIEIFDNLNSACDDLMDSAYDLHRQFQSSIKEQNMSEQVNHSQNIPDAEANSFVKTLNAVSKQMTFAVSDKDDVNDDLSTLMYRLWGPSQTVAHTIYRRMRGCWQPSTD